MAVSEDVKVLAEAVAKTLVPNPEERRAAETFLNSKQATPTFPVSILQLVALDSIAVPVRQAAAVYLKNYTARYYAQTGWESMPADARNALKGGIVGVVLSVPVIVRRQLSEVLAIMAEHEYPQHWPALVSELAATLQTAVEAASRSPQDPAAGINWIALQGALESLAAIFERYPDRMRSNELFSEINFSLQHTAPKLKALFPVMTTVISTNLAVRDPKAIEIIVGNVELMTRIFYLLSWQDLPEFFEDNLKEFMSNLKILVEFEDAKIDAAADDEPSCIDTMHASIIEILNLYSGKYDEEFRTYLQFFVTDVWQLLVKRSNIPKYDKVVTTGIKFLTTVSRSPDYTLFSAPSALAQVCNSIVIPNIQLREEDKELFEDNAVEYIRLDMEGSDSGTRRRGAVELVKGLCLHFETQVTQIFSGYVTKMLAPGSSWEERDAALYIVTALGWKSGTAAHGATETSSLINVVDFFNSQVLPDLTKSANAPKALQAPIFTADLIKYAVTFRAQIPKASYGNLIMLCVKLLDANEPVVKTYAAACIERLLTVKDLVPGGGRTRVPRMTKEDMKPVLESLLPTIVAALQNSTRADEYVMRLILRFCSVAKEEMRPYASQLVASLVAVLDVIIKNPANPLFNHYLFEALSALIRFNGTPETVGMFENALNAPMQRILVEDVTEFAPYVFQVQSQLMSIHTGALPANYTQLLDPIVNPSMWERRGYIPSMVQFLEVYIRKESASVMANNKMNAILGVFAKLLASKATDHLGLQLLSTIFEVYDAGALAPFFNPVMSILLVRLSNAKTPKYVQNLLYTLSVFTIRFGTAVLKTSLDSQQANLLDMLLRQVWVTEVASIVRPHERRVCAIGLADIACATDLCCAEPYLSLWPQIITTTVALTEGIVVDEGQDGDEDVGEEEVAHLGAGESYSAAHSQLQWGLSNKNRAANVAPGKDAKSHLAKSVAQLSSRHPGRFGGIIDASVDPTAKNALQSYIAGNRLTVS